MTPRVKSRKEVAAEIGVSPKTLYRWLKKAGIKLPTGLIDPVHLEKISKFLECRNLNDKP